MNNSNFIQNEYDVKCKKILEHPEIFFAGLLDGDGRRGEGRHKQGIHSGLTNEQHQSISTELASRVTKRKKFDSELGHVK